MAIKGLTNAVPSVPGVQPLGKMTGPMAALGGQGATTQAAGKQPGASQKAFADKIMKMDINKFTELMKQLGAGPIV